MNGAMNRQMNPQQWQAAEAIAQAVKSYKVDVNELKRIVSYLRWWQGRQSDGGRNRLEKHLLEYVDQLAGSGEIRSQQTHGYYQALARIGQENLDLFTGETEDVIQVLGWAVRLAMYYKND
jgi:hypothetical protein